MQLAGMFFNNKSSGDKPLKIDGVTLEVLVRFRTNLKLALSGVDQKTQETVYMGQKRDEEFHFVKFEGCLPAVEMSTDAIKKIAENFEIHDWTITDFDNCLQGNPHV